MFELIRDFSKQIREGISIGQSAVLKAAKQQDAKNVVICGLGGSGIGGDLVSELLFDSLSIPVVVVKGYKLPAFVNEKTLLVLCSYSGNTEEALANGAEAVAKGLKPVCVTAGGKLADFAQRNGFDCIHIPSGFPPRACLGYSSIQLFFILHYHGLISDAFIHDFLSTADFLEAEQKSISEQSEALALKIQKKVVIIYAEDQYESTALRLKQQINENSKMHCWYNVFPEVNHNELVGWKENSDHLALLYFRSEDEYKRNSLRMEFTRDATAAVCKNVFEIKAKGANSLQRHFYFIHFGDWLSYHLAIQLNYDPVEVTILTNLKNHLTAIPV